MIQSQTSVQPFDRAARRKSSSREKVNIISGMTWTKKWIWVNILLLFVSIGINTDVLGNQPTLKWKDFTPVAYQNNPKLLEYLQAGQYENLDLLLDKIQKEKKQNQYYRYHLASAYGELSIIEYGESLIKWAQAKPKSYHAQYMAGWYCVKKAWEERGGGWANTVSDKGWQEFEKYLAKAKMYLEQAVSINKELPYAFSQLITVAKGQSDDELAQKAFQQAIKADNTHYSSYLNRLDSLYSKWGGSRLESYQFAKRYSSTTPQHSRLEQLIIGFHTEMAKQYDFEAEWYRRPEVWNEIKDAFERLKTKQDGYLSSWDMNYYARKGALAERYAEIQPLMEKIGVSWDSEIWDHKLEIFLLARLKSYNAAGKKLTEQMIGEWYREQVDPFIKSYPNNSWNYYLRGQSNQFAHDYTKAEQDYLMAIKLEQGNRRYRKQLLDRLTDLYLKDMKNTDKLISFFDEYVERHPDNAEIYKRYGYLLAYKIKDSNKNLKKALDLVEKSWELDPDQDPGIIKYASWIAKDLQKHTKWHDYALEYLKIAERHGKTTTRYADALYVYGSMLSLCRDIRYSDPQKALEYLEKSYALNDSPDYPLYWYLAFTCSKLKQRDKAKKYCQIGLKLNPNNKSLKQMLENIERRIRDEKSKSKFSD